MAKPAAEFSLKDPARIEVICKTKVYDGINEEVGDETNLCVEARVRESEEEASEDSQVLVRHDVGGVCLFSLSKWSFEW